MIDLKPGPQRELDFMSTVYEGLRQFPMAGRKRILQWLESVTTHEESSGVPCQKDRTDTDKKH